MNKASETIVGAHTIAGRPILIQRTTWKNGPGLSYDILDADTHECLTGESFDDYPTDEQIQAVLRQERANRAAVFYPKTDLDTLPCIEVAGVLTYLYLDSEGVLQVSIHLDTTDPGLVRPDATVPLRVMVGDDIVFDDSHQSSAGEGA
ncbi:hypothetical protein [Thermomonospora umbrina]|uniref:Uncharacterized protein n=1 Tax=Thermomonospora umbrina TaxID=111806 RepID=A0A3D9SYB3_9ACTN|nr:hypothetical protein [Thermomonospora umbrina]REF00558.1 hypothetical protein DFJ69_6108 [Thermomonospora umbrina]